MSKFSGNVCTFRIIISGKAPAKIIAHSGNTAVDPGQILRSGEQSAHGIGTEWAICLIVKFRSDAVSAPPSAPQNLPRIALRIVLA